MHCVWGVVGWHSQHCVCYGDVEAVWFSGIVCGLMVSFQWSVNISLTMCVLEKQDGADVGVLWPHSSCLAFSPLSILNAHFWL